MANGLGRKDTLRGYLLIAPSLFLFAIFFLIPLGYNLLLSTQHWDMLYSPCGAGTANYNELATGGEFGDVFLNTILFAGAATIGSMALGLFLAVALNRRGRLSATFQACIFSSYIVSWVGISLLWLWLLNDTSGAVNRTLGYAGIEGMSWLSDPSSALWTLVGITIWKIVGYDMVIYLAGLQSIPEEVYEAGRLDGTTGWQRFRHLTWPLLKPSTAFLSITSLIMTFQAFDVVHVMTQGGPASSTTIYIYYVWEQAFMFFRTGYAAAAVTVFFLIILGLTILQFRWLARRRVTGERI